MARGVLGNIITSYKHEMVMKIIKSNRQHKKYMGVVDGKKIHFGDNRHGQHKDKIGIYSGLDHGDKSRWTACHNRHSGVDAKAKALAKEFRKSGGKHNAKTLSHMHLW